MHVPWLLHDEHVCGVHVVPFATSGAPVGGRYARKFGVVTSLSRTMPWVAEHISVLVMSATDAAGYCCFRRATRPATMGQAKLVPERVVAPLGGDWCKGQGQQRWCVVRDVNATSECKTQWCRQRRHDDAHVNKTAGKIPLFTQTQTQDT